jgi:small subunit ribosomal protein S21
MIIIDARNKPIEQVLKLYKNKHNKIGIVKELRNRQTFTKPSVERRTEMLKAKYVESKRIK